MSTALITTLYGAVLANGIFLPWYTKLMERKNDEKVLNEMMAEGILAIENGERAELVEQNLLNYLTPELKVKYQELRFSRLNKKKKARQPATANMAVTN